MVGVVLTCCACARTARNNIVLVHGAVSLCVCVRVALLVGLIVLSRA